MRVRRKLAATLVQTVLNREAVHTWGWFSDRIRERERERERAKIPGNGSEKKILTFQGVTKN